MKITFGNNELNVTREDGDKISKPGFEGTDPDSTFLYHVKNKLNSLGFDLIKKRMSKDGHMMGNDNTQYLRTRKPNSKAPHVFIYDGDYQRRLAVEDYNRGDTVALMMSYDVFNKDDNTKEKIEACLKNK